METSRPKTTRQSKRRIANTKIDEKTLQTARDTNGRSSNTHLVSRTSMGKQVMLSSQASLFIVGSQTKMQPQTNKVMKSQRLIGDHISVQHSAIKEL